MMRNLAVIRRRCLQDEPRVRLGGLAADLARIASFSDHDGHKRAVRDLIVEAAHFIEWTATDTTLETQAELVRLQVELACWCARLDADWSNGDARRQMRLRAKEMSEEVLELSGLLGQSAVATSRSGPGSDRSTAVSGNRQDHGSEQCRPFAD